MAKFRSFTAICLAIATVGLLPGMARAHPGSGIVVDEQGQVYFQDTVARTIWKIDAQGRLTKYHETLGGHWMALDQEGTSPVAS